MLLLTNDLFINLKSARASLSLNFYFLNLISNLHDIYYFKRRKILVLASDLFRNLKQV